MDQYTRGRSSQSYGSTGSSRGSQSYGSTGSNKGSQSYGSTGSNRGSQSYGSRSSQGYGTMRSQSYMPTGMGSSAGRGGQSFGIRGSQGFGGRSEEFERIEQRDRDFFARTGQSYYNQPQFRAGGERMNERDWQRQHGSGQGFGSGQRSGPSGSQSYGSRGSSRRSY